MKNDKKVLRTIKEINSLCYEFECTVKALGNQDAFTDRIVEKILNKSKELKDLFDDQFEKTANKNNILSEPKQDKNIIAEIKIEIDEKEKKVFFSNNYSNNCELSYLFTDLEKLKKDTHEYVDLFIINGEIAKLIKGGKS